jgi:hypothetical protein
MVGELRIIKWSEEASKKKRVGELEPIKANSPTRSPISAIALRAEAGLFHSTLSKSLLNSFGRNSPWSGSSFGD